MTLAKVERKGTYQVTKLQQARADARLAERIRDTDGTVFTKREWIAHRLAGGWKPEATPVPDTASIAKLEQEIARLRRAWEPSGNPNWPPTKRFYAIKQELADGPTKLEYRLVDSSGDRCTTITKTEYDYALTLPLPLTLSNGTAIEAY